MLSILTQPSSNIKNNSNIGRREAACQGEERMVRNALVMTERVGACEGGVQCGGIIVGGWGLGGI
jgi:hypothetical protein